MVTRKNILMRKKEKSSHVNHGILSLLSDCVLAKETDSTEPEKEASKIRYGRCDQTTLDDPECATCQECSESASGSIKQR